MRHLLRVWLFTWLAVGLVLSAGAQEPDVSIVPRPSPAKPVELKASKGQVVTLSAGKAKTASWLLMDVAHADLVPNGPTASFTQMADGRYRVVAAIDGALVLIVVVVGDAPGPKPPAPPVPPAPGPAPDTALKKKLRAAYDADPAADKAERKKSLVALYALAADQVLAKDEAGEYAVPTSGELLRRMKDAGATLAPTALVEVRKAVAGELAAVLGDDVDLTDEQRAAAAKLFRDIAQALGEF